ncbi:hypothetical protein G6L97_27170 (plasmid) [Agrobacterium tumefaciens]|uniref:hypothetical protein n=1 Tax=Agrobacterium tumefaciens TaxID=358 RepID=UPI001572231B|nr:hypothetical protein [Agrobacterium tumefaciens]WCA73048.1 hypothetical protein G6L97_27170 [Agrobacterium tumefaciens]
MQFSSKSQMPLRHLVELAGTMAINEEGTTADVKTRIFFDEAETEVEGYTLKISFKAAYISANAEGGEICGDTKHGMRIHGAFADKTINVEEHDKKSSRSAKGSETNGSASGSATGPKFGLGFKRSSSKDLSAEQERLRKTETVVRHIPVEMKGGDLWKVTNEDNRALSGTYLHKDQVFFRVNKDERLSNRFGASVTIHAKRRDIAVEIVGKPKLSLPTSSGRLLSLLVTKQLSEVAQDKNPETITFARLEMFDE